jgi:hypothetical protein
MADQSAPPARPDDPAAAPGDNPDLQRRIEEDEDAELEEAEVEGGSDAAG